MDLRSAYDSRIKLGFRSASTINSYSMSNDSMFWLQKSSQVVRSRFEARWSSSLILWNPRKRRLIWSSMKRRINRLEINRNTRRILVLLIERLFKCIDTKNEHYYVLLNRRMFGSHNLLLLSIRWWQLRYVRKRRRSLWTAQMLS